MKKIILIILLAIVLFPAKEAPAQVFTIDTNIAVAKEYSKEMSKYWANFRNKYSLRLGIDTILANTISGKFVFILNSQLPPVSITGSVTILSSQIDSLKAVMRETKVYLDSIYADAKIVQYQIDSLKAAIERQKNVKVVDSARVYQTDKTVSLTQAQIDSLQLAAISTFPNNQTYADVRNSWDWARFDKGNYDSCVVGMDTMSRQSDPIDTANSVVSLGCSQFWQCLLCPDDTIEVSYLGTFLKGDCFAILPNQSWVSKSLNIAYFTNVYWRRKGTAGTPYVQNKCWGF